MLRQSRAQARGMAVKTLLIMTTALTWLWLLLASQSFHFILSEAPEEAPLPFPLGSTPSRHVSPWWRGQSHLHLELQGQRLVQMTLQEVSVGKKSVLSIQLPLILK